MAGAIRAASQYDSLIAATIQFERVPQGKLQNQRDAVEVSRAIMDDFDRSLSSLSTLLKTFADPLGNPFGARTVAGGNKDAYTLAASDKTPAGGHTLEVHRLASADTRLSKQMTRAGTALRSFFDQNGEQTFSIGVAAPTADNPDNRVEVAVKVNPAGATDEDILKEIQSSIAGALDAAAEAGTIKRTQRPSASILTETSTTARLSLRSADTGFQGRLSFSDSANGLLGLLELDTDAVRAGTGGGQVYAVGTDETSSSLTASFTLDGVQMYRSTNSIADAMPGLTIGLARAGDPASAFSVQPNTGDAEKKVKDFVAKYNDVMTFLNNKTGINAETKTRSALSGDAAITGLRSRLRTQSARPVDGQPEGFRSLQDLGITINRDGTLELKEAQKLTDAAAKDPSALASLFGGDEGVASRLLGQVDSYLGTGGLIKRRQTQMDDQMKQLDLKINDWDVRLDRREAQLRVQYGRLEETLTRLQSQQSAFLSFYNYGF